MFGGGKARGAGAQDAIEGYRETEQFFTFLSFMAVLLCVILYWDNGPNSKINLPSSAQREKEQEALGGKSGGHSYASLEHAEKKLHRFDDVSSYEGHDFGEEENPQDCELERPIVGRRSRMDIMDE